LVSLLFLVYLGSFRFVSTSILVGQIFSFFWAVIVLFHNKRTPFFKFFFPKTLLFLDGVILSKKIVDVNVIGWFLNSGMIKLIMKILFVTGNNDKLREAKAMMPEIEGCDIDLSEIQEMETEKIIKAKLEEAMKQKPGVELIVEDQSLTIDGMNGLPGPFIKWFVKSLDLEGIYKLAVKMGNQETKAKTLIGYANNKGEIRFFEATIKGKIVSPRGEIGWGWDFIFQPEGYDKTFAQMTMEQKNELSMRRLALEKLKEYLKKINFR
jgi:inosine triphosphate pyrophosphatase